MLAPAKHRFTVKEYYRMAETGVLRPDARVELLNGEQKPFCAPAIKPGRKPFPMWSWMWLNC